VPFPALFTALSATRWAFRPKIHAAARSGLFEMLTVAAAVIDGGVQARLGHLQELGRRSFQLIPRGGPP
jgi:hypothetical protein